MVSTKTKIEKHSNDDAKRRRSIKEKEKAKLNQSQIIKQALTNSSLNNSSKKIVFSDENHDTENGDKSDEKSNSNKNGKSVLFEDSDSENESFDIKEKVQFSGKKGLELLSLQSTFGNDERFKIDERFLENDGDDVDEDKNKSTDDIEAGEEKAKQLKILESVLGTPVAGQEKEKKKKRTFEMIRYDASNKDHEVYEKINQNEVESFKFSKKRKEGKKTQKNNQEDLPKPKVSKEKFYQVSNDIKSHFKDKQNEGGQFSLLQTYGGSSIGKDTDNHKDKRKDKKLDNSDDEWNIDASNEFETALQEEEEIVKQKSKAQEKGVVAKGIWKESFFFDKDDARFKEGLEFINKMGSEEANKAAENFDQTRNKLKEIIRLHLKKQMHKKDPFKNKIGGMNNKQLAKTKFKNPKILSNKRKLPKRNFEKTT